MCIRDRFTVKRYLKNGDHVSLRAEGIYGDYPDININDSMEFEVWGVVTHTIHNNR